jgi:hypothetical protein
MSSLNHHQSQAVAERTFELDSALHSQVEIALMIRLRFAQGRDDTTALPQLVSVAQSEQMAWVEGATCLTFTTLIANLCKVDELALIGW